MRRILQGVMMLAALTLVSSAFGAGDFSTSFDLANKLFEEGKFTDAANAYDQIIATGNISEPIFFNRGNALFKAGQIGRAIASYRQAQELSPRDSEVRANLQFARTRVNGGNPYQADRWRNWVEGLTVNEWTFTTVGAIWTLFALLTLGQWRPTLGRRLRTYVIVVALTALAFGICLGSAMHYELYSKSIIVTVAEADVRNGPLDESPSLYKVHDGTELTVLDEKDGWLQVADTAERLGWLRRDQVLFFEPLTRAQTKKS